MHYEVVFLCLFLCSYKKPQTINLLFLFFTAHHRIDPRRIDVGMPKQIRQMTDISFYRIIRSREQMPEVMRRYLAL